MGGWGGGGGGGGGRVSRVSKTFLITLYFALLEPFFIPKVILTILSLHCCFSLHVD